LRVKGTNGDGLWNDEGASIRIVVRPPWWRTVWSYVLYAFLLTGSVYLIVLFERKREREKGELVEAELRAQAAELQSRTVEAEARALKVENERKAHELEQARKLQLSMLPTRLPESPRYAVAARMRTATEVGGDYYDFFQGEDGSLIVAMGDATGHGTRAGILVAVMKTLFAGTTAGEDLQALFRGFNRTLHAIGRDQIYMALGLLRLRGREVHAISAAVPPLFVWRSASREVEILTLRGMFLGTEFEIPYEEMAFTLDPGDQVLLLSDGYLEQLRETHERFDEERSASTFLEVAGQPPEEVVDHLFRRLDQWRGAAPQDDDVTVVVLQFKG
jgi:serine phosphatase RsbU (regulator of sigma subunit)